MTGTGPAGTDVIQLRGLRVTAAHGALEEEKGRAQPFEVDLDLHLDLRPAGESDDLARTVDYGAVAAAVAAEVQAGHADLLEHLAERIARAAVHAPGPSPAVEAVTVTVRKLRPPVPLDLATAGVRIHRRRDELTSRPGPADPGPRR
ncbi:MAG TPA: dihydroneopterin aldolase [Acidimicrobiales bacterium]|nr:dihydroneopterin aldolase [Acidimicrobiales bacterium]